MMGFSIAQSRARIYNLNKRMSIKPKKTEASLRLFVAWKQINV